MWQFRKMDFKKKVLIIGGGLSGLTLAYLLQQKNRSVTLLEASARTGGRIHTVAGRLGTPMELGATWFSDAHPHLLALIGELRLQKFPQYSGGVSLFQTKSFEPPQRFWVPESEAPSYRLAGGTQALITALERQLPGEVIRLNKKVVAVAENKDGLEVTTSDGALYTADQVVSCIPPRLAGTIAFVPGIPGAVKELLPAVHTWMAGAVKVVLEYEVPFWRSKGFSGMLYSHAGILTELYDHTNFENGRFALTGFLNTGAASFSQEVREELVLEQLKGLLGNEAAHPVLYLDKVWNDELVTVGQPVIERPHQNNGHPVLDQSYLGNRFFFCGAETASAFGGYMEGAVIAARHTFRKL
ncbi:flavin monoamine oxidase family protein [Niabella drilacis]|uniref:Monoamine oxidase n=1 Tax=Niabella drilacis (strain DSM 25811 / CCM 8410 / CCUG 62505 / LMG 26954 / E90) TaxID=1285928 RepID=A0A1G6MU87_NIADE|nr:NAD(P)/FAD-dependent oxidoreductase [Niabella drilacis]SDC59123.1 monoamine oxidase [Niabella drilacis]